LPDRIDAVDLELEDDQLAALVDNVDRQLSAALEVHRKRCERYSRLREAYKAEPEVERKTFPWVGASNVVIPIVGITVDAIVARMMKAFLGTKDLVEAQIEEPPYEQFEKDFRDWASMFFLKSGARDRCRTAFHDMALEGTAYMKVTWDSATRLVHAYGSDSGQVTATEVIDYEGPMWHEIAASSLIFPPGFDEWKRLPWIAEELRFTWAELIELRKRGMYDFDPAEFKSAVAEKYVRDKRNPIDAATEDMYTVYEIWGMWEIPQATEDAEPEFQECILSYSMDGRVFLRKIHNPFFGAARHIVRIPFLHQPHEIEGMGAAEQVLQFQEEASTAHNQSIDAATAAIAGVVAVKPGANIKSGDEIYPGKVIYVDDPKNDVNVFHLSMGNSHLPNVEQTAAFWAEKRSGVSSYSMGVESPIAGSRATATGTTALISEGNLRFWVSIDDMRNALEDLLYLTLQLEQQIRPEGTPITQSRMLQLPQGDIRTTVGLRMMITSEKINRDIEIQNLQMLIAALNDYYMRFMQAGAMIFNPQFPPQQKMLSIQIMEASQNLMKRFVERFDIENVEELVPHLSQAIQMMSQAGQMGAPGGIGGGPSPMAAAPTGGTQPFAIGPGGGPPAGPPGLG